MNNKTFIYVRPTIGYYRHPITRKIESISFENNKAWAKNKETGELLTEYGFYLGNPYPILTYSLHPIFETESEVR